MKFQTKFIALSGAAGLLALTIVLALVFSPANNQRRSASASLLSDRNRAKVGEISLTAEGKTISIVKNGEQWSLNLDGKSYPASADKVDDFFTALQSVKELYKISSKPESMQSFGLAPVGKRVTLKDSSGKAILDIKLGNQDKSGKNIYLAYEGKDTVLSGKNSFASFVRVDDRSWADLRVLPQDIKETDIQELEVWADIAESSGMEGRKLSYALIRDARRGWKVKGDDVVKLDASFVDQYLRALLKFESDSLVSEDREGAAALIAKPSARVTLKSGKGAEYVILASAQDGENRHVIKEAGLEQMFYTSAWTLRSNLRELESLKLVEAKEKK